MSKQKRVAAVHDLSGFGKCSLTVALPILSAAGVECACMPTAVLSTHTGGFSGYTYRDLSADVLPIAEHWKREKLEFDAVYAGYLGSAEIAEKLKAVLKLISCERTIFILDPVMADGGKLYAGLTCDMCDGFRGLCKKADLLTPNITEAALLTGTPYREPPYDTEYLLGLISGLHRLGAKDIVLTGADTDSENVGVMVACAGAAPKLLYAARLEGSFHGTGDVFTSALTAALMGGFSLTAAAELAMEFTSDAIARTIKNGTDKRYGVDFENALPLFFKRISREGK